MARVHGAEQIVADYNNDSERLPHDPVVRRYGDDYVMESRLEDAEGATSEWDADYFVECRPDINPDAA